MCGLCSQIKYCARFEKASFCFPPKPAPRCVGKLRARKVIFACLPDFYFFKRADFKAYERKSASCRALVRTRLAHKGLFFFTNAGEVGLAHADFFDEHKNRREQVRLRSTRRRSDSFWETCRCARTSICTSHSSSVTTSTLLPSLASSLFKKKISTRCAGLFFRGSVSQVFRVSKAHDSPALTRKPR